MTVFFELLEGKTKRKRGSGRPKQSYSEQITEKANVGSHQELKSYGAEMVGDIILPKVLLWLLNKIQR